MPHDFRNLTALVLWKETKSSHVASNPIGTSTQETGRLWDQNYRLFYVNGPTSYNVLKNRTFKLSQCKSRKQNVMHVGLHAIPLSWCIASGSATLNELIIY